MDPVTTDEAALLRQLLSGHYYTWIVHAVARLGIADHLADGPLSTKELAKRCQAHPDSLGRLLRAAFSLALVEETGHDVFSSTPMLDLLRKDARGSYRAVALMSGEPSFAQAWAHCHEAVRAGQTAFEMVHGQKLFDYLQSHPDAGRVFYNAQTSSNDWNAVVADAYELAEPRLIVDVGGGDGGLVRLLLERYPTARGIVLDLPSVIDAARQKHGDLEGRCEWVGKDFFEFVPEGGDVYLLRYVLHDWNDEMAVKILETCRAAMDPHGVLLVIENILNVVSKVSVALFDLTMMVLTGGRERTESEYRALLERAGFRIEDVRSTPALTGIIVARPEPA